MWLKFSITIATVVSCVLVCGEFVRASSLFELPDPPDRGISGNRSSGGSRDPSCTKVDHPLTAIAPEYKRTITTRSGRKVSRSQVWGLTALERPSFWFYLPYPKQEVEKIKFVLRNRQKQVVYQSVIPSNKTGGLVQVSLSTAAPGLQRGQSYTWYMMVKLNCSKWVESVKGQIDRVELIDGLEQQLEPSNLEDKFLLQAKKGLWYDSANALAELNFRLPKDASLQQQWYDFLDIAQLSHFSSILFVD